MPTYAIVLIYIGFAILGYLIGGINPAIVVSKLVYKKDIRTVGSGNPGFTNFKRNFGSRYAWLVLFLDMFKSAFLCSLCGTAFYFMYSCSFEYFHLGSAFVTLFAMFGHAYPCYYKFHGGKAFLVSAASIWFVDWRAGLISITLFMILLFTTHYMSLSVLLAAFTCPISIGCFNIPNENYFILGLSIASVLFLTYRHKENLVRLFHHEERKTYIFGHKDKKEETKEEPPKEA